MHAQNDMCLCGGHLSSRKLLELEVPTLFILSVFCVLFWHLRGFYYPYIRFERSAREMEDLGMSQNMNSSQRRVSLSVASG